MPEHRPKCTYCRLYSCIHWVHCHLAPQALLRLRNVWRTVPEYQRRTAGTDVHRASASIITELLEKIARLFDSTLDDLLERAMADEETKQDLERILRCNQDFKEQPMD